MQRLHSRKLRLDDPEPSLVSVYRLVQKTINFAGFSLIEWKVSFSLLQFNISYSFQIKRVLKEYLGGAKAFSLYIINQS